MAARRSKRARDSSDGPSEVEMVELPRSARRARTTHTAPAPVQPKPAARFQAALAQMREEHVSAHKDDKQRRIAIYSSHDLDRKQWSRRYLNMIKLFPQRALADNLSTTAAAAAGTTTTPATSAAPSPMSSPGAGDSDPVPRAAYITKRVRVADREEREAAHKEITLVKATEGVSAYAAIAKVKESGKYADTNLPSRGSIEHHVKKGRMPGSTPPRRGTVPMIPRRCEERLAEIIGVRAALGTITNYRYVRKQLFSMIKGTSVHKYYRDKKRGAKRCKSWYHRFLKVYGVAHSLRGVCQARGVRKGGGLEGGGEEEAPRRARRGFCRGRGGEEGKRRGDLGGRDVLHEVGHGKAQGRARGLRDLPQPQATDALRED